jgi:CobQ/CobB/MinD/ParA nucleotide binding domain
VTGTTDPGPRLTVISGAFGTGKTEIAINLALELRAEGHEKVTLVDLDIVNLYFRSRQKAYELEQQGIRVISSVEGMENADLPALSPEINACFDRKDGPVVFDLGGSDLGGVVASYFHRGLASEPSNHWLVVNPYRPFNQTAEATVEMAEQIAERSRLPITGMIANPHLITETTPEIIRAGFATVRTVTRYPLVCLSVMEEFYTPGAFDDLGVPVMVIRKQMKQPWEAGGIIMAGKRGKRCP